MIKKIYTIDIIEEIKKNKINLKNSTHLKWLDILVNMGTKLSQK